MRNTHSIYGIIERYTDNVKYNMKEMKARDITDAWVYEEAVEASRDIILESTGGAELETTTVEQCKHILIAAKEAPFSNIIQPVLISMLEERIDSLGGE